MSVTGWAKRFVGRGGPVSAVFGTLFFLALFLPAVPVQAEKLVVHLPSSRAESAGGLATAIDQMTRDLNQNLDGIQLEPEIFRRVSDLEQYLATHEDAAVFLTEAAFVADGKSGLIPLAGFLMDGRETYHRVVVVAADSSARRLSDLRGRELTVVRTAAAGDYLKDQIFAGQLDPGSYFSALREATGDNEAITDVLFGQAQAALVAEHASLLRANVDAKLRVVYRSRSLPLPVVSIAAQSSDLSDGLRRALTSIDPASPWLSVLGIDGFKALESNRVDRASDSARRLSWTTQVPAPEDGTPRPPAKALPLPYYLPLPESRPVAEDLLADPALEALLTEDLLTEDPASNDPDEDR